MARRSIERLWSPPSLLPGLAAAFGDHGGAYGMEEKLSMLRREMIVLYGNCCWRVEREVPVTLERKRPSTNYRREKELLVFLPLQLARAKKKCGTVRGSKQIEVKPLLLMGPAVYKIVVHSLPNSELPCLEETEVEPRYKTGTKNN